MKHLRNPRIGFELAAKRLTIWLWRWEFSWGRP